MTSIGCVMTHAILADTADSEPRSQGGRDACVHTHTHTCACDGSGQGAWEPGGPGTPVKPDTHTHTYTHTCELDAGTTRFKRTARKQPFDTALSTGTYMHVSGRNPQ